MLLKKSSRLSKKFRLTRLVSVWAGKQKFKFSNFYNFSADLCNMYSRQAFKSETPLTGWGAMKDKSALCKSALISYCFVFEAFVLLTSQIGSLKSNLEILQITIIIEQPKIMVINQHTIQDFQIFFFEAHLKPTKENSSSLLHKQKSREKCRLKCAPKKDLNLIS